MSAATTIRSLRWREPEPVKPFAKFLPLMRTAVAAAPERADLRRDLLHALFQAGAMVEVVERFRAAVAEHGTDGDFLYHLGRAALAIGNDHLAFEAFHRAVASGFAPACGELAEALYRLGRSEDALEAALQRLQVLPSDFASIKVVARVLLGRGEADRLWNLCVALRGRGAWGAWFSTVMASAAATLGFVDEFSVLVDRRRWFSAAPLGATPDFNQRLAAELLALRSSMGGGMRVDGLEAFDGPMTQELLAGICNAVEVYLADRQNFGDNPIIARHPASVRLHSWLITTHDHLHHGWHIHQAGWISGAYYVTLPPIEPREGAHPGAVEFGPYPFSDDEQTLASHRWHVTPEAGLLMLFPSYYAHRTRPTRAADLRICVPFDVRPSAASASKD